MISAEIVLDSISETGVRLITLSCTFPRFILSEVNTHRAFSRNSSSSRAIPVQKIIERVRTNPAMPVFWGKNQKGMQSTQEMSKSEIEQAKAVWLKGRDRVVETVEELLQFEPHKQIANRLLEPYLYHQTLITSTEWDHMFSLRDHKDAQPEFRVLAKAMKKAIAESIPKQLKIGEWHIPYISEDEQDLPLNVKLKISTARCARTSYFYHDGKKSSIELDVDLHDKLVVSKPAHCYDEQTEVLTDTGFSFWKDVKDTTKLAVVNQSGILFSFEYPKEIINQDYNGEMYHFLSKDMDLMVTPNHNLFTSLIKERKHRREQVFGLHSANKQVVGDKYKSVAESNQVMLATPIETDFPSKFVTILNIEDQFNLGRLVGFFVGDGRSNRKSYTKNNIYFHLKRDRKIKYLRSLAKSLDLELKESGDSYSLRYDNIGYTFSDLFYNADREKVIPVEYLLANKDFVSGLFDGLKNSDGSIKRKTWVYDTTSKPLANFIVDLATINGIRITCNTRGYLYRMNFSKNKKILINDSRKKRTLNKVDYNGKIYCANVGNNVLIVRRNGKIVLSGNSSPAEHQASAMKTADSCKNFKGWKQYRWYLENNVDPGQLAMF